MSEKIPFENELAFTFSMRRRHKFACLSALKEKNHQDEKKSVAVILHKVFSATIFMVDAVAMKFIHIKKRLVKNKLYSTFDFSQAKYPHLCIIDIQTYRKRKVRCKI